MIGKIFDTAKNTKVLMKGVSGMILIALLMVLIAILLIVFIAITGIGGAVIVFLLGDVIVSIGIIAWLISKARTRNRKK